MNMKAYTSLEQSKTLAEILPLESADMSYSFNFDSGTHESSTVPYKDWIVPKYAQPDNGFGQVTPCWSLAALLNVLDFPSLSKDKLGSGKTGWMVSVYPDNYRHDSCWHDNPIDSCYEMILKLHEQKLI